MDDQAELKVLIADDEPLAAERLQLLLARCPGIDLVGTASDGESAVRMAEALQPDTLLLDIAMPGLDGIEVADSGPGGGAGLVATHSTGVGLANIQDRLAQAYGAAHGFTTKKNDKGGFSVILEIPFETGDKDP